MESELSQERIEFHKFYKHEYEHILKLVEDELIKIQKRVEYTLKHNLIDRACEDSYKQYLLALLSQDNASRQVYGLIRQRLNSILDCGDCKEALNNETIV